MTTTYVKQSGKPSTFTSHTKQQIWAHINQNNMTSYSIAKTHQNLGFSQNDTLISIIRPCLRQGVCFSFTNIIHQKTKNTLGFWERHPFQKKNLKIHQSWKYRIQIFFEIDETYTNSYQTQRHSIPHDSVICKPTYTFHDLLFDMQDTILAVCWKYLVHVCKSIQNSTHQAIHFSVSKHTK